MLKALLLRLDEWASASRFLVVVVVWFCDVMSSDPFPTATRKEESAVHYARIRKNDQGGARASCLMLHICYKPDPPIVLLMLKSPKRVKNELLSKHSLDPTCKLKQTLT